MINVLAVSIFSTTTIMYIMQIVLGVDIAIIPPCGKLQMFQSNYMKVYVEVQLEKLIISIAHVFGHYIGHR